MAATRIMSLHTGKGRTVGRAISDILDYVENPQKTDNGRLISSYQCDSRIADAQFLFSKRLYEDKTGKRRGRDDVIAYTIFDFVNIGNQFYSINFQIHIQANAKWHNGIDIIYAWR